MPLPYEKVKTAPNQALIAAPRRAVDDSTFSMVDPWNLSSAQRGGGVTSPRVPRHTSDGERQTLGVAGM